MRDPLPVGYYAVPDPDDPTTMTYWRSAEPGPKVRRGMIDPRPELKPWPAKAKYGPRLLTRDIPAGLKGEARNDFIRQWYADIRRPWSARVHQALAADPLAAARRFAEFAIRCCLCGRTLTAEDSKVYGIGPECRRGIGAQRLADHFVPKVAAVHAQQSSAAGEESPPVEDTPSESGHGLTVTEVEKDPNPDYDPMLDFFEPLLDEVAGEGLGEGGKYDGDAKAWHHAVWAALDLIDYDPNELLGRVVTALEAAGVEFWRAWDYVTSKPITSEPTEQAGVEFWRAWDYVGGCYQAYRRRWVRDMLADSVADHPEAPPVQEALPL